MNNWGGLDDNSATRPGLFTPAEPLVPSSAGLPTPISGAATPVYYQPARSRPSSGFRPSSAASKITLFITEDADVPADNFSKHLLSTSLGARPLQPSSHQDLSVPSPLRSTNLSSPVQRRHFQCQGPGEGSSRPGSASGQSLRWRLQDYQGREEDGEGLMSSPYRGSPSMGALDFQSPLMSPFIEDLSKRRMFRQKTARGPDGGSHPLSSPLRLAPLPRPQTAKTSGGWGGSPASGSPIRGGN
jgi:hypothetical protein